MNVGGFPLQDAKDMHPKGVSFLKKRSDLSSVGS
jgi:hypothetical protein